ncbi:hypothetical protein H4696_004314 [Amycolatopsis lexingtonensis]|uniref:Uncharacterized protein n=1 Tax=Amycolatopsis lexingtonensis TaxID=218822 RepID=A0ABR9I236_9PSEU|nr:hypothetical protein [Amycolatopsis lexingtonensis]MBE1497214.1 hypothetical protein [Amycolatopsis lexingtonensis]
MFAVDSSRYRLGVSRASSMAVSPVEPAQLADHERNAGVPPREPGQRHQVRGGGRGEPVHVDRQPAVVGGRPQHRLDGGRSPGRRGQLADAVEPERDQVLDVGGRLGQVGLAETEEPVRVGGHSGLELPPQRGVIGGAFGVRPGAEQHGPVHPGLVEQGEVVAHRVVDVAVRIDDQRCSLGSGRRRNAAAGTSVER